jgi:Putative Ig domain
MPYQGFELKPVISGNIGTGVPSYKLVGTLPTGLTFNTITGVITGVPANINAAETSLSFVTVQLAVTGYTGTQEATVGNAASPGPEKKTGAFTAFGFVGGGFALTSATTAAGNVGVLGTISRVVTLERVACGGTSFDPIPAANLVGYGLVGTPPGALIDAATGVIRFTPPVSGSFTFQQYVDLLIDGKPARYRMADFTVFIA